MQFEQMGWTFTDEDALGMCKSMVRYALDKDVVVRVFVAEKDGYKTFVLYNEQGTPVFDSPNAEAVAVHIDIMAAIKEFHN